MRSVIDVRDGGFEGRRPRAISSSTPAAKFDKLYVDGDYVAKVYGDPLFYNDILPGLRRGPRKNPGMSLGRSAGNHNR